MPYVVGKAGVLPNMLLVVVAPKVPASYSHFITLISLLFPNINIQKHLVLCTKQITAMLSIRGHLSHSATLPYHYCIQLTL